MTTVILAVECRFPLGTCEASDGSASGGEAEWPPHPFRMFAALVAGAGALSRDGSSAADAARAALSKIERSGPPVVDAPDEVSRRTGPTTYPPKYVGDVKPSEWDKTWTANSERNPRPGVLLTPDSGVTYRFRVDVDDEGVEALGEAARRTPYLGRPTSPVMISVRREAALPPVGEGFERWSPCDDGNVSMRLPSAGTLGALDSRFATESRYGWVRQALLPKGDAAEARYSSDRVLAPLRKDDGLPVGVITVEKRLRKAWAPGVLERVATVPGSVPIPVFDMFGPRADMTLRHVLVRDVPAGLDVDDILPSWTHLPYSMRRTYGVVCGRSLLWTSLTPILVDAERPSESALEQAPRVPGVRCDEALVSIAPRIGPVLPPAACPFRFRYAHVTYRYGDAVTGPLVVDGRRGLGVMWPMAKDGRTL